MAQAGLVLKSKALQKTEFSKFCTYAKIGIIWFLKFGIVSKITGCFGFAKFLQNKFGNKYENDLTKINSILNQICTSITKLLIKTS